uniref:Probable arginine--tRNA ligase, mitochondrial n=1 Tax=Megaselia scalaris TaxID=36166 RepID=T1GJJ1_MEGSC
MSLQIQLPPKAIAEKARAVFRDLEDNKDSSYRKRWETFRHFTLEELQNTYERLGVNSSEYHWESQYSQKDIQDTIDFLNKCQLLKDENDGRKVVEIGDRRVPIVKSDGFKEVLEGCIDGLGAFNVVNYLFGLSNATSRALKVLNVKNDKCPDTQAERYVLFKRAKEVLSDGMKVLGLKPLDRM